VALKERGKETSKSDCTKEGKRGGVLWKKGRTTLWAIPPELPSVEDVHITPESPADVRRGGEEKSLICFGETERENPYRGNEKVRHF